MDNLFYSLKVPAMVLVIATGCYFLYANEVLQDSLVKSWQESTQYNGAEKLEKSPEFLFRAQNKISEKLSSQKDVVYELERNRLLLEGKVSSGAARTRSLERTLEAKAREYLTLKEQVRGSGGDFALTSDLNKLVNSINRARLEKSNLENSLKRSREALNKNHDSLAIANTTILELESDLENIKFTQSLAEVFHSGRGVLSSEAASEINALMADVELISNSLESENYAYVSDYVIQNSIAAKDSFDEFISGYESSEQPE